jgi:hypothetical protein
VDAEAFVRDPARLTVPPLDGLDLPHLRAGIGVVDAEASPWRRSRRESTSRIKASFARTSIASSSSRRGGSGRPHESPNGPQVPPRSCRAIPLPFPLSGVGRCGRPPGEDGLSDPGLMRRRHSANGVQDQKVAT